MSLSSIFKLKVDQWAMELNDQETLSSININRRANDANSH